MTWTSSLVRGGWTTGGWGALPTLDFPETTSIVFLNNRSIPLLQWPVSATSQTIFENQPGL